MSSPADPQTAPDTSDGLPMPRRAFATVTVMISLVLVVLDGTITNVALPTIHDTLGVSAAATVWVVTAYQLALVMGLLPAAALGESLGQRQVYLSGIALFCLASLGCALAPSLPWLVAARFVQGLGAAPLMALTIVMLRFTFPHWLIGRVIGYNAMVIALSAAAGPMIGSAILSVASWPWLFALNIPIGAVILLAGRTLPKPEGTHRKLDLVSVGLNAGGFGLLVMGAERVLETPVLGGLMLAASAIFFVGLVRREAPRPAPLIPLDLLQRKPFRLSVIASVLCFSGQMASLVALPFIYQHGYGLSPLWTGICMTPWPLMTAISGPLAGKMSDRHSTGLLAAIGAAGIALGLALAAATPETGSPLLLVAFTMISGFGFGFFQVPNNRIMLVSIPRERSGAAGGVQGTARLTGQTTGGLIMTVMFTLVAADLAPRLGLGIAAALTLAGAAVSAMRIGGEGQPDGELRGAG